MPQHDTTTKERAFDAATMPEVSFSSPDPRQIAAMSGLDILRAIPTGGVPAPTMARTMRQWIHAVSEGQAEFRGDPGPEFLNPMGMVHGGWIMTMLDSVLGCAVHSVLGPGQSYTSMGTEVKFIRPLAPDAGQVRALGTLVSRGRRSATAEARLEDASGRLIATGTTTCFLFPAQG